ncbi:hypothetical protein EW026_g5940 [Hermanssonia centrifuga]|uniref:Uncharacterized protein n=1 Tax=Hermanssonia centrifuga TaxID=98765 RepID=A0A4S4KCL5_9APHY|nr:hypothetical protein EW026_g5940 [Hermanssonia centrifuga]
MQSITGYHPDVETLPQLLDWLNELDRGWLAVLRSQAWDSDMHTGTTNAAPDQTIASMSQTERTRLRSLLISGTGSLEEWLLRLDAPAGQSYEFILESLGLQQAFDELFTGTLAEMGSLDGSMNVPQGMVGTC